MYNTSMKKSVAGLKLMWLGFVLLVASVTLLSLTGCATVPKTVYISCDDNGQLNRLQKAVCGVQP